MMHIFLNRFIDDGKQTLGIWTSGNFQEGQPFPEVFIAKSLELPYKNNQHNISCIPAGVYVCKYTRSNRLSAKAGHDVFTYEVLDVPNRAGIRIHSANYYYQLLGCIALGDTHKDINADGELDVIHSGNTVKKFNELMNGQDFKLIIANQFPLSA